MKIDFIYVLWSKHFPLRAKIGVSNAPKLRRQQVQDSIAQDTGKNVRIDLFFYVPVLWAYRIEQALHFALRRMRTETIPGSGHTEWFWSMNWISAIAATIYVWGFSGESAGHSMLYFAVFVFVPLPLDFVLFAALLALAEYAGILFTIWCVLWGVENLIKLI